MKQTDISTENGKVISGSGDLRDGYSINVRENEKTNNNLIYGDANSSNIEYVLIN